LVFFFFYKKNNVRTDAVHKPKKVPDLVVRLADDRGSEVLVVADNVDVMRRAILRHRADDLAAAQPDQAQNVVGREPALPDHPRDHKQQVRHERQGVALGQLETRLARAHRWALEAAADLVGLLGDPLALVQALRDP